MVFQKKTALHFFCITFLCLGFFTLLWLILEKLLALQGHTLSFTTPLLSLDLGFLNLGLRLNPGTVLGTAIGILLFLVL